MEPVTARSSDFSNSNYYSKLFEKSLIFKFIYDTNNLINDQIVDTPDAAVVGASTSTFMFSSQRKEGSNSAWKENSYVQLIGECCDKTNEYYNQNNNTTDKQTETSHGPRFSNLEPLICNDASCTTCDRNCRHADTRARTRG